MKDRSGWKLNPEVFSLINRWLGPLTVDLFAYRLTAQLPRFFSWRPDPEAESLNAFSQHWGKIGGKGYANPPWNTIGKTLSQIRAQEASVVLRHNMVPNTVRNADRLSIDPEIPRRVDTTNNTDGKTRAVQPISGNSMEANAFLEQAQKSSKSYDFLFEKWVCWCHQRGADPISGPISDVINFLAHLHEEGYQHRSLNAYPSAISSVHTRVDGYSVGEHPLVTRMLKGAFNQRPPQPCYESMWNVAQVTKYLEGMGANSLSRY